MASHLKGSKVALGLQLSHCPSVVTLGVKCNWDDYSSEEIELIRSAPKVYFPTIFFADTLAAAGKCLFPSIQCYRLLGDKIKQMLLFDFLGVPFPRTRVFWGSNRAEKILKYFEFPFIAKFPYGSSMGQGVFLIKNRSDLDQYLLQTRHAYIQEYIPIRRDLRLIVLGKKVVHSYWKEASSGEFRTNVAQGGRITFDPVPEKALHLVRELATKAGLDHAGFDVCERDKEFLILEANMHFGKKGLEMAGKSYKDILRDMVEGGII